ncbi:polysaccharide biosynthesis tyrosine autokinase [Promicromonospora soli]|uniref:non-specific protein-tyrosine kinase n=1 Tax=Promicromonospora soli TaxID=2035533 RepID=A0A919KY84_9MICO|nr:polysaccharide biosynthesis tyrosine autokinase [Promicromonospora soli]GHH76494.1 chromosome partitioning protein [Promicromonospora soli]
MGIIDYVRIARKRWAFIVAPALACLLVVLAYSYSQPPLYTAQSLVFVSFSSAQTTTELNAGATYVQRQVVSYTNLVGAERVLDPVVEELGLDTGTTALRKRVTAESPADTVLIQISATDEEPVLAAKISDAVAQNLAKEVAELETPVGEETSPVRLEVVRNAVVPTAPSAPNIRLNVAIALITGLMLGAGLAALREILDTRVRSEEEVAALTDTAVVGRIPLDESAQDHPLVVQSSPHHARSEAFRRLRTNLQFLDLEGGPQAIVVVSSVPNEGKSTTAINLAITLADADARVLLIDADLRRPSIANYLGIEGSVGLTTVLIHRAELQDVVQPWGSAGLFVVPSGAVPPNPAELVGSRRMAKLIEQVREQYDYVIIDTPPLLPVTDAALMAKMTSGALMVTGSGLVRRDQLLQSLGSLGAVNARVLGIVLNKVNRDTGGYNYGYEYYTSDPGDVYNTTPERSWPTAAPVAEPNAGSREEISVQALEIDDLPPRHSEPRPRRRAAPSWPTTRNGPAPTDLAP